MYQFKSGNLRYIGSQLKGRALYRWYRIVIVRVYLDLQVNEYMIYLNAGQSVGHKNTCNQWANDIDKEGYGEKSGRVIYFNLRTSIKTPLSANSSVGRANTFNVEVFGSNPNWHTSD